MRLPIFVPFRRTLSAVLICLAGCRAMAGPVFEPLDGFSRGPDRTNSEVTVGADGTLYGSTSNGGANDMGTIYQVRDGEPPVTLVEFDGTNGISPEGGVTIGANGKLYGVTTGGGTPGQSTAFILTTAGQLTSFSFGLGGARPAGGMTLAGDGNLYGMAVATESLLVYRMTPAGGLETLATLPAAFGRFTTGGLTLGADGSLYGTSPDGGPNYNGAIFKVSLTGEATLLASFDATEGRNPSGPPTLGSDGHFYGVTTSARFAQGSLYRMTSTGELSILLTFNFENHQMVFPRYRLQEGVDGYFYGVCNGPGGSRLFRVRPGVAVDALDYFTEPAGGLVPGPNHTFYIAAANSVLLYDPAGTNSHTIAVFEHTQGIAPSASLILGSDGRLHGTTQRGGYANQGTVFEVDATGTISKFSYLSTTYGTQPLGSLLEDTDGSFLATGSADGPYSGGGVFRIRSQNDIEGISGLGRALGSVPCAGVIRDGAGNLYGTTLVDGDPSFGDDRAGTIYKVNTAGTLLPLLTFHGSNGANPTCKLLLQEDGNLLGTTQSGGSVGVGTLFRITPSGEQILQVDFNGSNGATPAAGLIAGADGNYYGTTLQGGSADKGTVFRMTSEGELSTLAEFTGANGAYPMCELLTGPDGALYGTTSQGGSQDQGTVFRVTLAGALETVFDFDWVHGGGPLSGLCAGPGGHLYGVAPGGGTTAAGRAAGGGQVFRLYFGPRVETLAATDATATTLTLHGRVTPNGSAATVAFQVSTTPDFAQATTFPVGTVVADAGTVDVEKTVTGLLSFHDYYFRLVASDTVNPVLQAGSPSTAKTGGTNPDAGPEEFLFTALDSGMDDRLTPQEWASIYQVVPRKETNFALLDTDHDGSLDFLEFKAAATHRTAGRTYTAALERTKLFLRVDTDEDNSITIGEIARMWKPGTAERTIANWWSRAVVGDGIDFYEWLHLKSLPATHTYDQAEAIRQDRADTAAELDTDHDQVITFAEFSHLYTPGTKTAAIDTAWRAANGTARGIPSPVSMAVWQFIEATRLPKLVVY